MGFIQPASAYDLPSVVGLAQNLGVVTLAIGHAYTFTSLGYFAEQIAQASPIGLGFTNASAIIAPPRGKIIGIITNPISFLCRTQETV